MQRTQDDPSVNACPSAETIARLDPETPIALVLGGGRDEPISFIPGTLRQLAAALTPLMATEAVKIEIAKLQPECGDLVVLTCGQDWLQDHGTTLSRFWDDMFPGRALITLANGASIQTLTPDPAGLRKLAHALRPVLDELEAEEASR